jgi:hypothetical protein
VFVPPIPVLDETYERLVAAGFRELGLPGTRGLGADSANPELNADSVDDVERLIAAALSADPVDRIEYRDAIAAHGTAALDPLVELAEQPGLAAFAIRTISRIGETSPTYAVEALRSIDRALVAGSAIGDLDHAIDALVPRRAPRPSPQPQRDLHPPTRLEVGQLYRRRDLHAAALGGNRQKGISYPADGDHVLLFSGGSGHSQYGYDDHWVGDGRYEYYGEFDGLGDMTMTLGNLRIIERSPRLYLFVEKTGGLEFQGQFECESHSMVTTKRDGRIVNAIVFRLLRVRDRVDL